MKKIPMMIAILFVSALATAAPMQNTSDDLDQIFDKQSAVTTAPVSDAADANEINQLEAQLERDAVPVTVTKKTATSKSAVSAKTSANQ